MGLIKLFKKGELTIHPSLQHNNKFISWLYRIKHKHWIVSIQKSLNDVQQIVRYVGRYTKRACISEYKIQAIQPNIKFTFNDYANSPRNAKPIQAIKEMKPFQFLDALLQHVPDKRYHMIRYFGLYNSKHLNKIPKQLKLNQQILPKKVQNQFEHHEFVLYRLAFINAGKPDPLYCSTCKQDKTLIGFRYKEKFIQVQPYENSS
jgi:hypothetical protein